MAVLSAVVAGAGGCGQTERTITVTTEPAGALVYVNGREMGQTPVTFDFIWYGDYRFEVRKDGYETLKTNRHVRAAPHQWVGPDVFTALFVPVTLRDDKQFHFDLVPLQPVGEEELIDRARGLRDRTLHSNE